MHGIQHRERARGPIYSVQAHLLVANVTPSA